MERRTELNAADAFKRLREVVARTIGLSPDSARALTPDQVLTAIERIGAALAAGDVHNVQLLARDL